MEIQKKFDTLPFQATHLELMDFRQEEEESLMALPGVKERFEILSRSSLDAKTFMYDGRVIFCAGYTEMWPGVIDCWMVPSIYVSEVKLQFCRILRAYVNDIISTYKCHRFQTTAPDDGLHARWMAFLGMKREGVMKQFTHDKKDYCMYARTV